MSEVDDESVGYNLQGRVMRLEVVTGGEGGLSRDVDDDSLDHAAVGCLEVLAEEEEEEQPATGDVEGTEHEVGTR